MPQSQHYSCNNPYCDDVFAPDMYNAPSDNTTAIIINSQAALQYHLDIAARLDVHPQFSGAILTGITLDHLDLTRANFDSTVLYNVSFVNCNLTRANFKHATMHNVDFIESRLDEACFDSAHMDTTEFRHCHMQDAHLTHNISYATRFENTTGSMHLSNSHMMAARIIHCHFDHITAKKTALLHPYITDTAIGTATFDNCSFLYTTLRQPSINTLTIAHSNGDIAYANARVNAYTHHRNDIVFDEFEHTQLKYGETL